MSESEARSDSDTTDPSQAQMFQAGCRYWSSASGRLVRLKWGEGFVEDPEVRVGT